MRGERGARGNDGATVGLLFFAAMFFGLWACQDESDAPVTGVEAGQFCSTSDVGREGTSGSGETLVCAKGDGPARWERLRGAQVVSIDEDGVVTTLVPVEGR